MIHAKYTFRIDDVSLNTDADKLRGMIAFIQDFFQSVEIILAVSVGVHEMPGKGLESERTFPSMLHTDSDVRCFYKIEKVGVPPVVEAFRNKFGIYIASHGMIHADHRLLRRSAQELSIVTSCWLLGTKLFVPPFHKWNEKTQEICDHHSIRLIKFKTSEAEWRHLKYHKFDFSESHFYFHTHDFTYEQFVERFSPRAN